MHVGVIHAGQACFSKEACSSRAMGCGEMGLLCLVVVVCEFCVMSSASLPSLLVSVLRVWERKVVK